MIVVGTDGSAGAEFAIDTALELAAEDELFVVVTAWQELTGDFGLPYERLLAPDVADIEREWAGKTATAAADRLRAAGHSAEAIVRHGKAAKAICAVAAEVGARLVVVGSTGWGPIEGLLMGSVSAGVLGAAPCAVVTVRLPNRTATEEPGSSRKGRKPGAEPAGAVGHRRSGIRRCQHARCGKGRSREREVGT